MNHSEKFNILALQLPSPPKVNILRDMAGGFGVAGASERADYGHDENKHVVPYGCLINCAAILNNLGYNVSFTDAQSERLNIPALIGKVKELKPQIIVTGLNLPSLSSDLQVLEAIKMEAVIVDVGKVGKVIPELILGSKIVDYTLTGDAEVTIAECVERIVNGKDKEQIRGIGFKNNGNVFMNPDTPYLQDLDSLPLFPHELIHDYRYSSPILGKNYCCGYIMTSKGCPFPCKYYCPYPIGFGDKVRYRNPVKVADEIQLLQEKCGVQAILFRDQVFTLNRPHVQYVCQEIIGRNIKIDWCCETRLDLVDRQILDLMKKAGCVQINYGLESADPQLFAKTAKPGKSLSDFKDVIAMTKSAGIKAHTHLIVGLPGENWQTVKNTARTLKSWQPDSFYVNLATPYPGTKFYEDARKNNWLQISDFSAYSCSNPVVRTQGMSLKDMIKAQKYIRNELQGNTIFKRLTRKVANWLD